MATSSLKTSRDSIIVKLFVGSRTRGKVEAMYDVNLVTKSHARIHFDGRNISKRFCGEIGRHHRPKWLPFTVFKFKQVLITA